jgi:hypothetical protein
VLDYATRACSSIRIEQRTSNPLVPRSSRGRRARYIYFHALRMHHLLQVSYPSPKDAPLSASFLTWIGRQRQATNRFRRAYTGDPAQHTVPGSTKRLSILPRRYRIEQLDSGSRRVDEDHLAILDLCNAHSASHISPVGIKFELTKKCF